MVIVAQVTIDDELAKLTSAIVAINGWNRFAIAFRATPGVHPPANRPAALAV